MGEERFAQIDGIAGAHANRTRDRALRFLEIMDAVDPGMQGEFMARILSCAKVLPQSGLAHICELKEAPDDQTCDRYTRKHHQMVEGWVETALRRNSSLDKTAMYVWARVSQYEGHERTLIFTLLLSSRLVPYAQMPPDFVGEISEYATDQALRDNPTIAGLAQRALGVPGGDAPKAAMLSALIDSFHGDPETQTAIILWMLREGVYRLLEDRDNLMRLRIVMVPVTEESGNT